MAGNLCGSDEEDGSNRRQVFKAMRSQKRSGTSRKGVDEPKREKFQQEFDTNVFQVALECLENKGEVATGDAEICKTCSGVFSKISQIVTEGEQ